MQTRRMGNTDLHLTEIGLGCWAMGGHLWGTVDDQESTGAIHRALDLGINWYDTADVYGFGRSEEVLGKALGSRRQEIIVATKCGLNWDENQRIFHDNTRKHLNEAVRASLRRLNTDYIDLYQIHWPDKDTPLEETMTVLEQLRESGKVRYLGVSNFSVEQMREAKKYAPLHCLQPPYNLFQREVEKEILPFCRENEIGVVAYSPMFRGLLTGKFKPDAEFPEGDHRRDDAEFKGERFERNLAAVEGLRAIASKYGKTVGQLAVAWVLMHPALTSAIVGAKRASQVEDNIGGAGCRISDEDMQEVERILAERAAAPVQG